MSEIQHFPIPIDEKIAHLRKDEVDQLFNAYHYSEAKAGEIIKRFGIDYKHIGGLRYILKNRETLTNSCPQHNVYCWQSAKGRNEWGMPFCPICNENAWEVLPQNYYEPKPKLISPMSFQTYKPKRNELSLSVEKYKSLEFPLKVLIMCWDKLDTKKKTQNLSFLLLDKTKVFPNRVMMDDLLHKLEESGIITGDRYFLRNIYLTDELFEHFGNGDYLLEAGPKAFFNFWWELAYHEVLEYLFYELNKKNISIRIETEINHVMQFMVSSLSVQQCMFATWAAIKDSCSLIAEKNWDLDYARNVIPKQLKHKADRIIEGSLKEFPFNRTYTCKQSKIATVFYNDIAKLGDVGFIACPNIDLFYTEYRDESWLNDDLEDWGELRWNSKMGDENTGDSEETLF